MPPSSTNPDAPVWGAAHDVRQRIGTHLFLICPNNSGSTFLKNALAESRHTWNLKREGPNLFGFAGPASGQTEVGLIWGAKPEWTAYFLDPAAYDWPTIRKGWYFQAYSRSPEAEVFVTKAPPFLLIVDQLVTEFPDARFLFMVRDPYAVAEGVVRRRAWKYADMTREALLEHVARHLVVCFERQAANVARYVDGGGPDGGRGIFFTYERLCAETEAVQAEVAQLVPVLDDLDLGQRVAVKGLYDEPLRDMNAEQIARLSSEDLAVLNEVFAPHASVFAHFGYTLRLP